MNPTRTTPPCYNNKIPGNRLYAQRKGPNVTNQKSCIFIDSGAERSAATTESGRKQTKSSVGQRLFGADHTSKLAGWARSRAQQVKTRGDTRVKGQRPCHPGVSYRRERFRRQTTPGFVGDGRCIHGQGSGRYRHRLNSVHRGASHRQRTACVHGQTASDERTKPDSADPFLQRFIPLLIYFVWKFA